MRRLPASLLLATAVAAAGCGPTLRQAEVSEKAVQAEREKQQEAAFRVFVERQDRLAGVAFVLQTAGAAICGEDTSLIHGFSLHDPSSYEEGFRESARRHFGMKDGEVRVRYVHPKLPAASAGLRAGDRVLEVAGRKAEGKSAADLRQLVDGLPEAERLGLRLSVEREGRALALTVPGARACGYPVEVMYQDAVNAFADGKRAVVTSGMMRFAAKDEELALVVGHELAHNALGHYGKKVGQTLIGSVLDVAIAVTTGINTGGLFGGLTGRTFSQEYESEADYAGLYVAARAGFDVSRAADFWRRMAAEHPGSIRANFLATHPSAPERFVGIENAVREIEQKRREGKPLLPEKK